ncbi:hypothetical protein [Undibacterium crateris]|uniref:hypothetical protein n=1 Tax=Undibacterium crateris TaxID=2528175 RepID=UPI00138A1454|nr:hypothetical protein [Undibacterium crateris]NDI87065.1 hypothetical protein [Undibacterium crateris]
MQSENPGVHQVNIRRYFTIAQRQRTLELLGSPAIVTRHRQLPEQPCCADFHKLAR